MSTTRSVQRLGQRKVKAEAGPLSLVTLVVRGQLGGCSSCRSLISTGDIRIYERHCYRREAARGVSTISQDW
jgi:hypothetical protein